MRIVRFHPQDLPRESPRFSPVVWGVVDGDWVRDLKGAPFDGVEFGHSKHLLADVRLCPPVKPGKVVAIGLNYREHIREMGHEMPEEPLIFFKATSSVIAAGEHIELPMESERVDYEGELAVVIGKRCRRVSLDDAEDVILGYTILNDVTARDLQRKDGQFARAKSFDTFCPLGPWIETDLDPTSVRITTVVNSELRQDAGTASMLFSPFQLVAHISGAMTLEPGDIIATGTPSGVGPLKDGDKVSVAVEGIGVLTNPVRREVT